MKHTLVATTALIASTLFLGACAHEFLLRAPAAEAPHAAAQPSKYLPTLKNGQPWNAADPELRRGELTVWKLQEMAQKGQFDEINDLFNHGLTMDHLPVGYSAGAGVPFPGANPLAKKVLDFITGVNWRGKIFFDSGSPTKSHGFNRILLVPPGLHVQPAATFLTTMIGPNSVQSDFDQPELANGITSNFVVLNYAVPNDKIPKVWAKNTFVRNYFVENVLKVVPVYDVMVAVPGKYGPLYVGKTWLGEYAKRTHTFHTSHPDFLIAYYFLDYNPTALEEQKALHWDGGKEDIRPIVEKKP